MATTVEVPVSVGELLDKVTILRIKRRKITDPGKLANVAKELDALVAVCERAGIALDTDLVRELEEINGKLWEIEDDIRDKERRKEFDEKFIELARSVYITNDRRFAVKARINEATGSAFREEKSYQAY